MDDLLVLDFVQLGEVRGEGGERGERQTLSEHDGRIGAIARRACLVFERVDDFGVERARREAKVGELDVPARVDEEVLHGTGSNEQRRGAWRAARSQIGDLTSGLRSRWMYPSLWSSQTAANISLM